MNVRSLFVPESSVLNSGVCTWCAYDSRNPVFSVTGNETRSRGDNALCPTDGVNTRASELAYAVSFVNASEFQPGSREMKPGVFENSAFGLK